MIEISIDELHPSVRYYFIQEEKAIKEREEKEEERKEIKKDESKIRKKNEWV
jgi:hypothetical protein